MKYLKFLLNLDSNRLNHSLSCAKFTNSLICKNKGLDLYRDDLITLALLHDIGYSEILNKLDFHSLDGAIYLKGKLDVSIVKAIANHSGADSLLEEKSNKDVLEKIMKEFKVVTDKEKLYLDVINFVDCHIDGQGNYVSLEDRYKDIANRYGKCSIKAKTNLFVQKNLRNFII